MSDQPLSGNEAVQPKFEDLPAQQRQAMVQKAATALTTAYKKKIDTEKQIDFVDNEITTRIMFVHIQALTNLLVEKGLLTEPEIEKCLISAFATQAMEMNKPKLLVPKH